MRFIFADDSRQQKQSRDGMGALVAIGGVCVAADDVRPLEAAIGDCCQRSGFPKGDEFKWSPERGSWMYDKLKGDARSAFFKDVLAEAKKHNCKAFVVIEDEASERANREAADHEEDAIRLFVERVGRELDLRREDGVMVVDRPGGGRGDEDRMLEEYLELLETGTKWVKPKRVALNVLSSPSHCIRLLQLADLITGCTLAAVSGEPRYRRRYSPSSRRCSQRTTIGSVTCPHSLYQGL